MPKFHRKLKFQFGVLKFPLNFLWKTQISLQIFESPLARHAGCYCPIFEPSMLIFEVWGHAPSVMTVMRYEKLNYEFWLYTSQVSKVRAAKDHGRKFRSKTNDLILNLTPENVTQHSRIATTTRKGSSTPTKMSKIIGRQIH